MKASHALLGVAFLFVIVFIFWCAKQKGNDTPKVFYRKRLPGSFNGFTVPPFGIFIKEAERKNAALLEHELTHWRQFQREGFLPFVIGYGIAARREGYDRNPYEIEARAGESDFCKTNYTECVRTGQSKTVSNPNFRTGAQV